MGHILVHNTRGTDDLERASLAFVVGNTALNSGQRATVLLTIDGVWLAMQGKADGKQANGFAPLSELISNFIKGGGEVWACGSCTKPRGIVEGDLIKGAAIVGATTAVEAMVNGAQTLCF